MCAQDVADDYERQIKGLLGQIDEGQRAITLLESRLASAESRREQEARTFAVSHADSHGKLGRKETRVDALIGQIAGLDCRVRDLKADLRRERERTQQVQMDLERETERSAAAALPRCERWEH